MTVKTYLEKNRHIHRFYLQHDDEVCECNRDYFDDMNLFGGFRVHKVTVPEGADEIITLYI